MDELRDTGARVEDLLWVWQGEYDSLFHGSYELFETGRLRPTAGKLYAAENPAIALGRAVLSNEGLRRPGLQYPLLIYSEHPLEIRVHGLHQGTVKERGYVYVIKDRRGFTNDPRGSSQYVSEAEAQAAAIVPVLLQDFNHPVWDMDAKTRIR